MRERLIFYPDMAEKKEYKYGDTKKEIHRHEKNGELYSTTITDGEHAKLIVKLKHESFTKAHFFRAVIRGYINDDVNLQKYLDEYRSSMKRYSKTKQKVLDREKEESKAIEKKFGLNEDEIEDMYDLFDEETGL